MVEVIDFTSRSIAYSEDGDERDPQDVFTEDLTPRIVLRGLLQIARRALTNGNVVDLADSVDLMCYARWLADRA